jgi:GTPase SAR1 family protein
VGKTQLINRIVSNNFCEEYEPTVDEQKYRLTYRTTFTSNQFQKNDHFVELVIEDMFPIDHPLVY